MIKEVAMMNKNELRKQEIMETAMELFKEKGYKQTSMRDIAKKMNVSLGLCYRYFDSKQIIFNSAIDIYIQKCCDDFLKILNDDKLLLKEKIDYLYSSIVDDHDKFVYHNFFHQIENQAFHQELSIKLCQFIYPHLLKIVKQAIEKENLKIQDPEILVSFIVYGHLDILSCHDVNHHQAASRLKEYVYKLIDL